MQSSEPLASRVASLEKAADLTLLVASSRTCVRPGPPYIISSMEAPPTPVVWIGEFGWSNVRLHKEVVVCKSWRVMAA